MLPLSHGYSDTLGGSLTNEDPIKDIRNINIEYQTYDSSGSNAPKLYYGENNYEYYEEFDYSLSENSLYIHDLHDVNYFKIDSGDTTLRILSISIDYSGVNTTHGSDFNISGMGVGKYRAHPDRYSGTLESGVSSVTVPIDVTYEYGGYTVKSTKTYTYYSYSDIQNNPSKASAAAMITPMDVSNYYSIFGEFPANYVSSSNYSAAYSLFGNLTRQVSSYSKTDGYARYVPWQPYDGGTKPRYHEFDIDLTGDYAQSSYSPNRGVGRVVAFESGFNVTSYGTGNDIVCLFTDDHYSTWQEFNNLGDFLPRFSVQRRVTNYAWSEPTLINQNI